MATTILVGSGESAVFGRLMALLPEADCRHCRAWDLPSHAAAAEVLVVDDAFVDEGLLRLAPRLRLVQLLGPGLSRVDLEACGRRGVYIASVPWCICTGEPSFGRLVEPGEPASELAASTLARVVAGNVRRLLRGQAPLFWANPPACVDPDQAFCGRAVVAGQQSA